MYFVLFVLFFVIPPLGYNSHTLKKNIYVSKSSFLLISIFTVIIGFRYDVGLDYIPYKTIIEGGNSHFYYEAIEFIPRKLIDVINYYNLPFYIWFVIMSLFLICFILKSVPKNSYFLLPYILLCFNLLFLDFCLNGVRQGIALITFLCACKFIKEQNFKKFLFYILIGSLFHKSIIFWIPVWFIYKIKFQSLKSLSKSLLIGIIIATVSFKAILNLIFPYLETMGYAFQANLLQDESQLLKVGSGLGLIFKYIRWGIIILYYPKLSHFYKHKDFNIYFNIFFIYICVNHLVMENLLLDRFFMYSAIAEIYVLSYLLYYLIKSKNSLNKIVVSVFLVLQIFLTSYAFDKNIKTWDFVWELKSLSYSNINNNIQYINKTI